MANINFGKKKESFEAEKTVLQIFSVTAIVKKGITEAANKNAVLKFAFRKKQSIEATIKKTGIKILV